MTTRRLSKTLKHEIRNNIEVFVRKKMDESIPGKELASMKKSILIFLKKEILKKFTEAEFIVLKKYGHISTVHPFRIIQDVKGHLREPWTYKGNPTSLTLEFTPTLETPKNLFFSTHYLIKILEFDEKMKALTVQAIKTFDHIECEIKETINAFMEVVDTYKTVNSMIKNYPDLEKFIPKEEKKPEHVVSKKAQAIIKNFKTA